MPIYEYACRGCGKVFEELIIRRSDEAELACPDCGQHEVSRLMSRPAAAPSSGGGGGSPRGCGPVG
jgi:putative FmdB family regulatory protein